VLYLFSGLVIIALGQRMHEAERLAEGRARQLVDNVRILSASQGRLQLATEVSGTGVFQWDARADRFEGENPEAYRIFGRKPEMAKLSLAGFFEQHVHPADVAAVRGELELARRPGERLQVEFRYRRGMDSESWRWVQVIGRFLFDEGSAPTHLIGVITDITERREMEDDLRRMAADLSNADHRKDEFLATLAHELRNPLAPIRNGIELLKRGGADPVDNTRAVVGVMERQMSHLVRLVDDLIDVSRITRNKLELRRHSLELAPIVQSAVEACRPLVDAKGQQLTVSLPPMPVHVDADSTRLAQVLTNLLNNASKYTERGGHLAIALERQARMPCSRSATTAAASRPRCCRSVRDVHPARPRDGTLPGRTRHRTVDGQAPGRIAWRQRDDPQATAPVPARAWKCACPTVLSPMPQGVRAAGDAGEAAALRRILVADDNADAAESLAQVLRLTGNEVLTVVDGVEAVEQVPGLRPRYRDARHRHAAAQRLRSLPPPARAGRRRRTGDHRGDRLGPGRGPGALARSRLRPAPDQARGSAGRGSPAGLAAAAAPALKGPNRAAGYNGRLIRGVPPCPFPPPTRRWSTATTRSSTSTRAPRAASTCPACRRWCACR
jgi:PAS domain S-box-containing protein